MKRAMLMLAMLGSAVACGSDKTTAPTVSAYVGSYTLTMLNGSTLPTTVTVSNVSDQVTAGTAQVLSNGTWTATITATPNAINYSGTYTVGTTGVDTLYLTNSANSTISKGTLSNGVLSVQTAGTPSFALTLTKN